MSAATRFAVFALFCLALPVAVSAQQTSNTPDRTIDAATRAQIIDYVLKMLNESYVFPDAAKAVEQAIRERVRRGEYDQITSARAFGGVLTEHLREASKDKHIGVRYWPVLAREPRAEPSAEDRREASRRELAWINYGFNKVERLRGNIGYIELNGFTDAEAGAETVAAAMNFVANTNALIFDLRANGGGRPEMVALISSYLFEPKPVHLNDLYCRTPIEGLCEGNQTRKFWTRKKVAGNRYLNKEVYILTSKRTFSAAEEFAYNLKNLKRATIVGETTGGGANPGTMFRFLKDYQLFVSQGRAINPITKTNWDGEGVKPDVDVSADQSLMVARLMALKNSLPTIKDPEIREGVQGEINQLEKELNEMKSKSRNKELE